MCAVEDILSNGLSVDLKSPEIFEAKLLADARTLEDLRFLALKKGLHKCQDECLTEKLYQATLPENDTTRDDQHVNLISIMNDAHKLSKLMAGFSFSHRPEIALEQYADVLGCITHRIRLQCLKLHDMRDTFFSSQFKIKYDAESDEFYLVRI